MSLIGLKFDTSFVFTNRTAIDLVSFPHFYLEYNGFPNPCECILAN